MITATISLPTPSPQKICGETMLLTIQPKFWPKNPVMYVSGRKIVAMIVSCFETSP